MSPSHRLLMLRLILSACLVMSVAWCCQHVLLSLLLPVFAGTLTFVLHDFTLQSLVVDTQTGSELLRLRADLAAPLWINNVQAQPLLGQGWYEVTMTGGGVLQYAACMTIVILAWPAATWRQARQRWLLAAPLGIGLTLLNVAITLPAELWAGVTDQWLPGKHWPLITASQMLMGVAV